MLRTNVHCLTPLSPKRPVDVKRVGKCRRPLTCCVRLYTRLHVLGFVAQSVQAAKLLATCKRTQQLPTMLGQQICVCLYLTGLKESQVGIRQIS